MFGGARGFSKLSVDMGVVESRMVKSNYLQSHNFNKQKQDHGISVVCKVVMIVGSPSRETLPQACAHLISPSL